MGAEFNTTRFKCSRLELPAAFKAKQEELRREMGSGAYQGHLGLKTGLQISLKRFASHDEAFDYCCDGDGDLGKWGPAIAVRVEPGDGEPYWLVAGWCSS